MLGSHGSLSAHAAASQASQVSVRSQVSLGSQVSLASHVSAPEVMELSAASSQLPLQRVLPGTRPGELPEALVALLRRQEMAGERLTNRVRMGFVLLGVLMLFGVVADAQTRITNLIWRADLLCFGLYALWLWWLLRDPRRYYGWLKYVSIVFDTTFFHLMLIGSLFNHSGVYEVYRAPAMWTLIACSNGLTALRYSPRSSVFAGVLTLLYGGALLGYLQLRGDVPFVGTATFVGPGLNLDDCIQDSVYAAVAAFVAAVVSRDSRRLVLRAALEATARQRLQRENRAEQALRAAEARLHEAEKLSALGRMLAQLSHEINNPVNVIGNNVPPMQEYLTALCETLAAYRATEAQLAPADRARLAALRAQHDLDFVVDDFGKALSIVGVASERMGAIHRDLSVFLRASSQPHTPRDVNQAARDAVLLCEGRLPRGARIVPEYGELPKVPLREGQLQQVLVNLLNNAADAIDPGGEIRLRTEVVRTDAGDRAQITITDTGPGVPESLRARIFEPFFTTKDIGKGTGLGLAICTQIVREQHGGDLTLDGDYTGGARFVIRLPLVLPDAADGAGSDPSAAAPPAPGAQTEP